MEERRSYKADVIGSIPIASTIIYIAALTD